MMHFVNWKKQRKMGGGGRMRVLLLFFKVSPFFLEFLRRGKGGKVIISFSPTTAKLGSP